MPTNDSKYIEGFKALNRFTKGTNARTYGISRDIADVLTKDTDDYIRELNNSSLKDKNMLNSHISKTRLQFNKYNDDKSNSIASMIYSEDVLKNLQTIQNVDNVKFAQILKDYEIVKRCIPQIHRVLTTICNNILSPDATSSSPIGIEYPSTYSNDEKLQISKIIEKYDLNSKLSEWVMEYLVASVKYVVVIPYSTIPDMLESNGSLNESISLLESSINSEVKTLKDYGNGFTINESIEALNESIDISKYVIEKEVDTRATIRDVVNRAVNVDDRLYNDCVDIANSFNKNINEILSNIEFENGSELYVKRACLTEAVGINSKSKLSTINGVLDDMRKKSSTVKKFDASASEGLVATKTINNIRKSVDFKGSHIEELPASKIIPLRIRGTLIGYFYIESKSPSESGINNLSSIIDKINTSVYMKNDENSSYNKRMESTIVKVISDKILDAIDAKWLNDNYEDIDIIYQFVRSNMLWNGKHRITFFHPDDICDFTRKDGSIMKNCMFDAKLYILTLLSNVLANVTRGTDRQIHYVKTGLTTDISGHVNSAIRALKQNQIRYSDTGTINEVFNIVGSMVDVFMPVSVDGEKPIETETISGQNVDMNNDFLNSLIKSIIQSFGIPSSVIDEYESVDFAKTLAMSNIDMAKSILNAQHEINPVLTKLIRKLIAYELPEIADVENIEAELTPPAVILTELTRERFESIDSIANLLTTLYVPQNDNETQYETQARLFKLEYFKKSIPSLDWELAETCFRNAENESKVFQTKANIMNIINNRGE